MVIFRAFGGIGYAWFVIVDLDARSYGIRHNVVIDREHYGIVVGPEKIIGRSINASDGRGYSRWVAVKRIPKG